MELRETLADEPDIAIVWVMADEQINEKSIRFIEGMGMRERIVFARDPGSAAIDTLGIRLEEAEEMEAGVPHPTTWVLDSDGIVRFVDSRHNYHFWLDSTLLKPALASAR